MIGIVVVAHGGLAAEYVAAVEHVVGSQDAMTSIAISAECNRAEKTARIKSAADAVDRGAGVVIVVDMFGGSPSNLSLPACSVRDRCILYGANLPMLIQLAKSRDKPLLAAVTAARDAGRRYIGAHIPTAIEESTSDA